MIFYIYVHSGLNNKLIPLLSLLRIAKKENKDIKCYWGPDAYILNSIFEFNDLFEPINNISFIDKNEYDKVFKNNKYTIYNKNGSDRDRKEIIYISNNNISIFHKIVHLISYKEDNVIGNYVPYPRSKICETNIITELKLIINELKPKQNIIDKIDTITTKFKGNNVIGFHIRTTDGGFTNIPRNEVYNVIDKYVKNNFKIYISCDNLKLEKNIISKFSSNIIYFDNPFGNKYEDKFDRKSYGTINAICEMFILSKCNKFLGTPGSSFSFMVWLLRNDNILDFWCNNPWK
jgi:hypothetical protein